ncbi:MAG TPA: efflux RND transporter periplasmic adaptor subunit [Allocoleopsis sp.]
MMRPSNRSQLSTPLRCVSGTLLSLILLTAPSAVLAHGGHGDEFKGGSEASQTTSSVQIDAETAKRLGIKVEPVKRQRLAVGIKTTGQIETLPNKKVEVNTPITGTVVELLAKPGDKVSKGQPVAVLSSSELAQLRVESVQKRAEADPSLKQAQADLQLARANLERQRQIAAAEIEQASTEVKVAQEQYDRDQDLVRAGALPRRNMLESSAHLAEGKAKLTQATSRKEVLDAENKLKRAEADVEVAQSRIRLSDAGYKARLQQLGTIANEKGLVTVVAPISGTVSDREITPGETVTAEAGSKPLMSIVNDSSVFATANIYEKDLNKVQTGQRVSVKVASLPERTFTGRITVIGSVVQGETRVVPVKAEIDNSSGQLKPGMFAQLEVLTDQTPTAILAIPSSAVVEANGKKVVYIQNGNAYQSAEVMLGQTSGDMVEVKSGLFEGDLIVTQRAPQLYAQSLRGGSKPKEDDAHGDAPAPSKATDSSKSGSGLPWWLVIPASGGAVAALAGAFWLGRRTKPLLVPATAGLAHLPEDSPNGSAHESYPVSTEASSFEAGSADESPSWNDNHRVTSHEKDTSRQR